MVSRRASRAAGSGTLYHSWEIPSPLRGLRLSRIYGTRGSAVFESNGLVVAVTNPRLKVVFPGFRDISGYGAMFADFFDSIRTRPRAAHDPGRAQRGIELIESAYTTAEVR